MCYNIGVRELFIFLSILLQIRAKGELIYENNDSSETSYH